MDRALSKRLREAAGKYRYAAAAALLGVLLMLLPAQTRRETPAEARGGTTVQSEIEAALAAFDGAGRLRLVLTVEPGTERWAGAVIVCEGADSPAVRLQLTQAVAALTGLSADRIAVVKGRP